MVEWNDSLENQVRANDFKITRSVHKRRFEIVW